MHTLWNTLCTLSALRGQKICILSGVLSAYSLQTLWSTLHSMHVVDRNMHTLWGTLCTLSGILSAHSLHVVDRKYAYFWSTLCILSANSLEYSLHTLCTSCTENKRTLWSTLCILYGIDCLPEDTSQPTKATQVMHHSRPKQQKSYITPDQSKTSHAPHPA